MSNLTGSIAISPKFKNRDTVTGLTNPSEGSTASFIANFSSTGTAANQVDTFYSTVSTTLAASATDSIDLSGTLEDGLGNAAVFATLKSITIFADATNVSAINIDATIVNAFESYLTISSKIIIPPGGGFTIFAPVAGFAVTTGTGDLLAIENTDGSNTAGYSLILAGTSV